MDNFPAIGNSDLEKIKKQELFAKEVAGQINKDASLQQLPDIVKIRENLTYNKIYGEVKVGVQQLSAEFPGKLKNLLYQIDVSESKVRMYLEYFPFEDHIDLLTAEIINRSLKKIILRNFYSSGPS